MTVLKVTSRADRQIRLTEVQWDHMTSRHPEVNGQEDKISETLEDPDFIYHSLKEENYHYLKYFEDTPVTKKYLLIIAKHLNKEGFVITGFFLSRIKTSDKVLVYGKESINKL